MQNAQQVARVKQSTQKEAHLLYNWLYFAERSGQAGAMWTEQYKCCSARIDSSAQVLKLAATGQYRDAEKAMYTFRDQLEREHLFSPAAEHVLRRFLYGAAAYLQFQLNSYDEAKASLRAAHESITRAVNEHQFLSMLAAHSSELQYHLARIAREQQNWTSMHMHLQTGERMFRGEIPLCLASGVHVYMTDLASFGSTVPDCSPDEARALLFLKDPIERSRLAAQMTRRVQQLPFMETYGG